jgi:arylsulfatase A-like enzyme
MAEQIRNVLLATYDCARADVIHRLMPPTFARLAERGVRFSQARSAAPLTPVSHATIFTGRYPYKHGLRHLFREKLPPIHDTLAGAFLRASFETGAIVSCPGLKTWYGHNRGFAHYDDWLPALEGGQDPLSVPDVKLRGLALKRADMVVDRAMAWIAGLPEGRRWFLFTHFFDAHWPYEPPERFGNPGNDYEGELTFCDAHFGRLIDRLEETGALDETLVVVLGDHGEDLAGWYENDKAGPEGLHPEEEGHGCCLYEQTQHVPLLFSHPSLAGGVLDAPVSLADVAPTISGLLGLTFNAADGADLSECVRTGVEPPSRTLYAETMYPRELVENTGQFTHVCNQQAIWTSAERKIIRRVGADPEFVAFDLTRDPFERTPIPLTAEQAQHFDWPSI